MKETPAGAVFCLKMFPGWDGVCGKWGGQKTKSAKSVATVKIHEPVTLRLRLALGGFVQIFTILLSNQMDKIQNTYFLEFMICLQYTFSDFTGVKTCLLVRLVDVQADLLVGGSLALMGAEKSSQIAGVYALCWRSL